MNNQNVRIEKLELKSDQVPRICRMLKRFYQNDYEPYMINEDNKYIDRHSFVALTTRNSVAGFILVHIPIRNPLIVQFLVSDRFRGQGLGYRLLTKAIEDIEQFARTMDARSEYKMIYLDVPATAQPAIALYTRNGFTRSTQPSKNIGTQAQRMVRTIEQN